MGKEMVKGISTLLNGDLQNIKSIIPLMFYLNEYQIPLHDKLLKNGSIDMMTVNLPHSIIHLSEQMKKIDKKR